MRFLTTLLGAFAASMFLATPAFADIKEADMACPLMTFNETDLVAMATQLATDSNGMSEAFDNRLTTEAAACQEKLAWTDQQAQKILLFDVARMVAIYFGDAMEKGGLELAPFDALVADADADKLREMIGSDNIDPKLDDALALLTKQKGSDISKELAGAVGGYMSGSSQAKLYSLELQAIK
jgi:hypothetical protein